MSTERKLALTVGNEGVKNLGELWKSLNDLSAHIVEDNNKRGYCPEDVRRLQIHAIKAILREIEAIFDA